MKSSAKNIFSLASILTGAFALLCAGFWTYALLFTYDPHMGHFEQGAFSDVFLPLLYILAAVVFLVFGFLFRDGLLGRGYKTTLPSLFASGFAALTMAVWLFTFLLNFTQTKSAPLQTVFGVLLILFGAIATGYFVWNAMPSPPHTQTVLWGLGAVLFCLIYAFYAYFDTSFALNSPIKLLDQITMIALMLFFLAEGRFRFGAMREAVFLPICMLAVVLCAANSIGALVYTAVEGRPLVVSVMHDFVIFGFFLYALTRLLSFSLPAFVTEESEAAEDRTPTAFEAEGARTGSSTVSLTSFAQETFDFDKEAEEEQEAFEAEEETEPVPDGTVPENASEATLDFDRPDGQ